MDIWALSSITAKFILYAGVLFAAGTVFYTLLFETGAARFRFAARQITAIFATTGLLAAPADYGVRAASLTGEAASMVDPEMLAILWETPVGTVLTMRVLSLALVLSGLFASKSGQFIAVLGGIIALASFTRTGHTTDVSGIAAQAALLVHLVGIVLWAGILLPLYRLSSNSVQIETTAEIARRFGRLAMIFVPILLTAGGWLAFELVGSFENAFFTGYSQTPCVKIAVVIGLSGLAAANKLRFVPALNAGDAAVSTRLNWSLRLEIVLVILVLALTAVLTSVLALPEAHP